MWEIVFYCRCVVCFSLCHLLGLGMLCDVLGLSPRVMSWDFKNVIPLVWFIVWFGLVSGVGISGKCFLFAQLYCTEPTRETTFVR